jgi:hypothetical protein
MVDSVAPCVGNAAAVLFAVKRSLLQTLLHVMQLKLMLVTLPLSLQSGVTALLAISYRSSSTHGPCVTACPNGAANAVCMAPSAIDSCRMPQK